MFAYIGLIFFTIIAYKIVISLLGEKEKKGYYYPYNYGNYDYTTLARFAFLLLIIMIIGSIVGTIIFILITGKLVIIESICIFSIGICIVSFIIYGIIKLIIKLFSLLSNINFGDKFVLLYLFLLETIKLDEDTNIDAKNIFKASKIIKEFIKKYKSKSEKLTLRFYEKRKKLYISFYSGTRDYDEHICSLDCVKIKKGYKIDEKIKW